MRAAILAAALLASGCASSNWNETDTRREIAWQIVNAADAVTTAQIQHTPGVIEKQPLTRAILGPEPDSGEVALYFSTLAVSHWAISRILPPRWRKHWQRGSFAYSAAMVVNNCRHGLCE
jgi:hypothetical protein